MTTITLPPEAAIEDHPAPEPLEAAPTGRRWDRYALWTLLAGTAVLYLWGLGASGWGNAFYSAAVQAGTKSWKAFFFGSSDAGNSITVDKPPASLWVMGISARIFGVSSWSILAPQALEGVAAVALLYAAVKRWFGAWAGLIAGAALALTPVAVLMFRFNNPDALLVLLLVAGAYCMVRAVEDGSTAWLALAGAAVGFGFLTKMLQAFLVLPAFAVMYFVAAPVDWMRRIRQLVLMGAVMLVAGGWWVAIVELWPDASRPYIGGSTNNSVLDLIFGYNGLGRVTGNERGSVGGGQGVARWGPTGWTRMFNSSYGAQASWLIPAALVLLVALGVFTWRSPRTSRTRAATILWGGWLVVTGLVFSLSKGIIHEYYTVALAPAIGALIGIGGVYLWRRRHDMLARGFLAAAMAAAAGWSVALLRRVPDWNSWLRPVVLVVGLGGAVALLAGGRWLAGRVELGIAAVAVAAALLGPGAYAVSTAATVHDGALPTAGPGGRGGFGPGGGGGPFGGRHPGGFQLPPGVQPQQGARVGGLLEGSTSNAELTAALQKDASSYRWVAAAIGANSAAGFQLASGDPVMPIGGFNGTDPSPTLAQFQTYVAAQEIHYFIAGGGELGGGFGGFGGGPGGIASGTSSAISTWVTSNFTATTIGGVTVYDLTQTAS